MSPARECLALKSSLWLPGGKGLEGGWVGDAGAASAQEEGCGGAGSQGSVQPATRPLCPGRAWACFRAHVKSVVPQTCLHFAQV